MSMGRGDLTHEEWARLKPHLPKSGQRGGRWASHRRVINGILCRLRTGVPWRDLPACFGPWKTVYERHRRWSADGTWDGIFAAVLADADAEGRIDWSMVSVDSTSCRAHQHAAGARRNPPRVPGKRCTPRQHRPDEGLGRSRPRPDLQDPPRWRGWTPPLVPADHSGPVGRCSAAHSGHGTPSCWPPRWRTPAHAARPSRRRQGVLLPSQPPLSATTPDQAAASRRAAVCVAGK
jgi:transposase